MTVDGASWVNMARKDGNLEQLIALVPERSSLSLYDPASLDHMDATGKCQSPDKYFRITVICRSEAHS